ncbi:Barrier-to-autointegration factor 1 [Armadillidium vulgare]|nr:Barrier-to-autointegration factor 1 [Armadillidium vulgare]
MGLCQGNFQNLFKMSGISETESKMALAPNSSIEGKKLRDIAGIGPATEKLLLSKNFTKASDVYRQYVLLNKDGEAFSEWLKEDIGMRRKCDIESCLNDIKSWQEPRVRTPQTRRDLENNAQDRDRYR